MKETENFGKNSEEISALITQTKYAPVAQFLENSNWLSLHKFDVATDPISFHIPLHR